MVVPNERGVEVLIRKGLGLSGLAMAILTSSPFLKADEIPDFLRALDSYTGSRLFQSATKLLMITGVLWSTKTGHGFRVFPVSVFRFVWR